MRFPGLSINLLLLVVLAHVSFPRARPTTTKFLAMSYYNAATEQYGAGIDDLHFVALWIVLFTGLRAAAMDYVLFPLARAGGVRTNKDCVRFAEQAWLLLYYCVLWPAGMVSQSPICVAAPEQLANDTTRAVYHVQLGILARPQGIVDYLAVARDGRALQVVLPRPARVLAAAVFCHQRRRETQRLRSDAHPSHIHRRTAVHQLRVLQRQSGHNDPVPHGRGRPHLSCTCHVAMLLHGWTLNVAQVAKLLKYLDYRTAPDIAFGIFMAVWVVARHGFYLTVCWSLYVDLSVIVGSACHLADGTSMTAATQPDLFAANGGHRVWRNILHAYLDRDGPVCFNTTIRWSFLSLLLGLQVITLLWLIMIFKVAFRVLRGEAADDIRSDDEATEDVEDALGSSEDSDNAAMLQAGDESLVPLEQEVGVESLTFPRRSSPGLRRSAASRGGASRSSGISIPGHGDRKELLGRIGCDKPS